MRFINFPKLNIVSLLLCLPVTQARLPVIDTDSWETTSSEKRANGAAAAVLRQEDEDFLSRLLKPDYSMSLVCFLWRCLLCSVQQTHTSFFLYAHKKQPYKQMLSHGSIAIIQYNSRMDLQNFAFVALVNISGGTVINFTDRGWRKANMFRGGEGVLCSWNGILELRP